MSHQVKIIAGEWRGRNISFPDIAGLRPTPARVRETLFNWLQYDIIGSRCLDLYAGSGALGLEAASRGAKQVLQIDNNAHVCRQLKTNTQMLSAQHIKIVQQEVLRYLSGDAELFDVVFLDPPFGKGLVIQTLHWLEDKLWLSPQAKIYVEVERGLLLEDIPDNWQCIKDKIAGEVRYCLFERAN